MSNQTIEQNGNADHISDKSDSPQNVSLNKTALKLNRKQRVVLLCTAIIIILMVLYPPYIVNLESSQLCVVLRSGYEYLFELPSIKCPGLGAHFVIASTVNVPTLLAQILAAVLAGGLICIALKNN